jgi:GntR family transcriptional regulator, rspAB operon transcriptional repressor
MSANDKKFSTRSVEVYKIIQKEIVTGQLPPGTRLVRRELAKRFSISPIPIIEALYMLERDGLTESTPMYGSRVINWDMESLRSDEMLREAIECQCARLCAVNASQKDLTLLQQIAEMLDKATIEEERNLRPSAILHYQLHSKIAELTGCKSLITELEKIWLRRQMRFSMDLGNQENIPKGWHSRLVSAIASRNPQKAEDEMRRHVEFGQDHDQEFIDALKKDDFTPPAWLQA